MIALIKQFKGFEMSLVQLRAIVLSFLLGTSYALSIPTSDSQGTACARAFKGLTNDVTFDPAHDDVAITLGAVGNLSESTLEKLWPSELGPRNWLFPISDLEKTYSIGRPTKGKIPSNYRDLRLTEAPKLTEKDADPLELTLISRGQLTFKRSPDGTSIILFNGIFDEKGTFVPARTEIRISPDLPSDWSKVTPIPSQGIASIALAPRSKPYYVLLPNNAIITLTLAPQKKTIAPPKNQNVSPSDPKEIETELAKSVGGRLAAGELVTLKSKPRLPDHPNGNHYVGFYHGVIKINGRTFVELKDQFNNETYWYRTDKLDFAQTKKGIDAKLFGPGPGNLLAKPKQGPINPEVTPFDVTRNIDAQLKDYLGSLFHPENGPSGWYDYALQTPGMSHKGNSEGAREILMPDGTPAFVKTFAASVYSIGEIENVVRGIRRLGVWASQGRGPKVYGVGYKVTMLGVNKFVDITLVMENMLPLKQSNNEKTVNGNVAAFISAEALKLPDAARVWLRDSLLLISSATNHPDPHLKNVGYRITHLRSDADIPKHGNYFRVGDRIVEVYAIDPTGILPEYTKDTGAYKMPQYNSEAKRRQLNKALNLKE